MSDSEDVKTETAPEAKEESVSKKDPDQGEKKPEVKKEANGEPSVAKETPTKDEPKVEVKPELDEEPTELETKIITQIEYYFGDYNLCKDKFLNGKMKEDDGWILMSVLLTFNRLKSLTEDADAVLKALGKSTRNLIEISDDKTKIRRNPEKAVVRRDNWKDEEWHRTAYVKGFPVDATMDIIIDFFKNEGKVSNIYMRKKMHSKSFKGSVFVTFETKEELEAFVKKDDQKYKNTVLIKEKRHDYQARKEEEFSKRKEDREKRKLERDEKNAEEEEKAVAEFNPEEDMQKSCLMRLTGFAKGTKREDIKDKLNPHGPIAYVDFKIGDEEAVVRFEESGIAKDVFEKSKTAEDENEEKKLIINGAEITATFPEGEEEIDYWKKIVRAKTNFSRDRRNHKRRGGGSGGRGGKHFRGGRGDFRGRGRGGHRGRSHDRHEKNGDSSSSDRKRPADAEAGPPVKKEKADS